MNDTTEAPDVKRARGRRPCSNGSTPSADRLPPRSTEAEQAVLSCVMMSPNECMGECLEKLKEGPEVFYDLRHQTIYQTMAEMFDTRLPIDIITLQQRLKDNNLLDEVGGLVHLSFIRDFVPTSALLTHYLEIVQEKSLLRK